MNVKQALKNAFIELKQKNILSANLDAEVLLLEALNKNKDKSWLYINTNYELNKNEEKLFNNFISQRKKHKPVAYIINRKEFYGYDFYVDENVLIPRPETELIVDEVLEILEDKSNKLSFTRFKRRRTNVCSPSFETPSEKPASFTLIDIGTGSGCIIMSILNELTKNKKDKIIKSVFANDISKEAIKIAKINAKKYNLEKKIKFINGDLEKALDKKIFSTVNNSDQVIITANLPYIKSSDYKTLQPNVKNYEPATALKGGEYGLDHIEKLIDLISELLRRRTNACSPSFCCKKIFIILEANPEQMNKITAILNKKFTNANIKIIKDLSGKKRIISATI